MSELKPGDLVEIEKDGRFFYVQVTHLHASYPELIRGLEGHCALPARDPAAIASQATRFVVASSLSAALASGALQGKVLGNFEVPQADCAFPLFKMPITDRFDNFLYWWFWDGDSLTLEPPPDVDTTILPVRAVVPTDKLTDLFEI